VAEDEAATPKVPPATHAASRTVLNRWMVMG